MGIALGVGVDVVVGVAVGVAVGVTVTLGVGVGVEPGCAQYLPPVFKRPESPAPPQTVISLSIQSAV